MYNIAPFCDTLAAGEAERKHENFPWKMAQDGEATISHCNNWCTFSLTQRGSLQI